jgi:hypothetical protein
MLLILGTYYSQPACQKKFGVLRLPRNARQSKVSKDFDQNFYDLLIVCYVPLFWDDHKILGRREAGPAKDWNLLLVKENERNIRCHLADNGWR